MDGYLLKCLIEYYAMENVIINTWAFENPAAGCLRKAFFPCFWFSYEGI